MLMGGQPYTLEALLSGMGGIGGRPRGGMGGGGMTPPNAGGTGPGSMFGGAGGGMGGLQGLLGGGGGTNPNLQRYMPILLQLMQRRQQSPMYQRRQASQPWTPGSGNPMAGGPRGNVGGGMGVGTPGGFTLVDLLGRR